MTATVSTYHDFLRTKQQVGGMHGFSPVVMPDFLFDFQRSLVEWALLKGRGAVFADCGLGKTPMQLVWADNVRRKTNKPVLIVTPLAVSGQTVREAEKFGIDCRVSRDGKIHPEITVTNYERLHYFNPDHFSGVVCDESSILKNFDGVRRKVISEFLRKLRYRLLCTATAAPNDFIELGTSSEALGELGHMDMLARFFKNDDKTLHLMGQKYGDLTQKGWRFKSHAEEHFWKWICSWARACRKPSDLGFDDRRFIMPPLNIREHKVAVRELPAGVLFEMGAVTLQEQREEQRRSITDRCERVAELLDHDRAAVAWCHLNEESELLERLIPDSKQVTGSDSDDLKEELFEAFASGQLKKLVTKPKIGGFGMNWQHCCHQTFFPSHSFEQWYQAMRRSWRYGQTETVTVDVVSTDGSENILVSLKHKSEAADRMFAELVRHMHQAQRIGRSAYGEKSVEVPSWL